MSERWTYPVPRLPCDTERWRWFCRSIELRIRLEQFEHHDGKLAAPAFVPPLPSARCLLPTRPVPIRTQPIPTTPRDARGRWRRREDATV
jgi:hypothetical protein